MKTGEKQQVKKPRKEAQIVVRLPEKMREGLTEKAQEMGLSLSEYARHLILKDLKRAE